MKTKKNIGLMIIFFLIFSSCAYDSRIVKEGEKREDYYIIWAHSDIQPRNDSEREGYETALLDIKNNFPVPDMAIVGGDIVHDKTRAVMDFEWFLAVRDDAGIKHWFEIAGNHDMKLPEAYFKYTGKPFHYAVELGNMLLLFLSDEDKSPPTEISDEAFKWWKKLVVENQDKIIITVTHGYPKRSGLFAARFVESRTILGSERFENVMKDYRVDLWLAAHTHIPSCFGFNERRKRAFNNTLFINISRIRRDLMFNPESRIVVLKNGSNLISIMARDHHRQKYKGFRYREVKLAFNFDAGDRTPRMIYFKEEN